MIPTAICKKCGELIFHSQGSVDRKGAWTCLKCEHEKNKPA
jgi:formylmethanofuran dehydrogenase subunit E